MLLSFHKSIFYKTLLGAHGKDLTASSRSALQNPLKVFEQGSTFRNIILLYHSS